MTKLGVQDNTFTLCCSGGQQSEISFTGSKSISEISASSKDSGRNCFLAFPASKVAFLGLWLLPASSKPAAYCLVSGSPCLVLGTFVITCGAHPDYSESSSHLKILNLIAFVKSFLPHKVTFGNPRIRTWNSLEGFIQPTTSTFHIVRCASGWGSQKVGMGDGFDTFKVKLTWGFSQVIWGQEAIRPSFPQFPKVIPAGSEFQHGRWQTHTS